MTSTSEELKKIQIEDDVDRIELFGNMDANLNLIREHTGTEIFQRDNCLLLRGGQEELAEGILKELMVLLESGEHLDLQKVNYIISIKKQGLSYRDENVSKDIICFTSRGKPLKPKTIGQKKYVDSIRKKDVVFVSVLREPEKPILLWRWQSAPLRIRRCRRLFWQDRQWRQGNAWVFCREIYRKRWTRTCVRYMTRFMMF